jgi:Flp pilus assembly pilin Flp
MSIFRRLWKCERAATKLEYTLIAALLGLLAYQASIQVTGFTPTM